MNVIGLATTFRQALGRSKTTRALERATLRLCE